MQRVRLYGTLMAVKLVRKYTIGNGELWGQWSMIGAFRELDFKRQSPVWNISPRSNLAPFSFGPFYTLIHCLQNVGTVFRTNMTTRWDRTSFVAVPS